MKRTMFVLFIFIAGFALAQDDKNVYTKYIDENVLDFIYKSRPMIEVGYGYGSPVNKKIMGDFANVGNWDIKLGKSEQKNFAGFLIDLNERYVFGSYLSSSTQSISGIDNNILTDAYRFGFGSRDGVGFGGSGFSVVPYVSQDFVWTQLSNYEILDPMKTVISGKTGDEYVLDDYLGTFRFGDKATYGLKVELASMIQLNANYETSVVYRRHLFWYWSGSYIISQAGYNALGYFTDEIMDNSPVLGSIFNFALKAGYLYGYYLLRQENMNWPFNMGANEAPLTYETINVGFTFLF